MSLCNLEQNKHAGTYCLFHVPTSTEIPIYVGKSTEGRGGLIKRLNEHRHKIEGVVGLETKDFLVKWLPFLRDINTLSLALEQELININKPDWNVVTTGFGNHYQGKNRENQKPSLWDQKYPKRVKEVSTEVT